MISETLIVQNSEIDEVTFIWEFAKVYGAQIDDN